MEKKKNVVNKPTLHKIIESKNVKYLESPPALSAEKIITLNNLKAILTERTLTIDIEIGIGNEKIEN